MDRSRSEDRWIMMMVLATATVLMVTMGLRMSLGLFVQPLLRDTTLDITSISFAMAVSQLMWGAAQPVTGALADRHGAWPVLWTGTLLMAGGCVLMPFLASHWGLTLTVGFMIAVGAGAGSFSILMSLLANRLPPQRRGFASGVLNAGGSFGQFLFAPVVQAMIVWQVLGWQGAMFVLGAISLATLPICWWLVRTGQPGQGAGAREAGTRHAAAAAGNGRRDGMSGSAESARSTGNASNAGTRHAAAAAASGETLRGTLRQAFKDRSYILLHLGFFTCGFHISFLVTHLPTEVNLCGLPASVASWSIAIIGITNVLGSLVAGWCVGHYRSKYILFWMYASRAALIVIYLMSPRTDLVFYLFAAGLGLTWLATVPPTASIVGKLFGVRYLATLFGLTLLSHQVGGFLGAWLGGQAITAFGDYGWMWYADIALSGLAAVLNLPIREQPVSRAAPAAA